MFLESVHYTVFAKLVIHCELASSKSSALLSHMGRCHTKAGGSVILKQKEHSTVENDSCAHHDIFKCKLVVND